ncbi:unnamed protein product [Didymodactylos carnosus]|uniref:Uncharacterized protein n=1 Tax=Didymodactylos carnosus TaxID=1234261 RepID=A0A815G046_9BILA|nr:unnamed protein product [Didymodactylos carnosus]CAF4136245.1 unnamed protein product [Didymodactylos carnosus]CAF4186809.1 unnamed protein product [Didymodactylos carnosus]
MPATVPVVSRRKIWIIRNQVKSDSYQIVIISSRNETSHDNLVPERTTHDHSVLEHVEHLAHQTLNEKRDNQSKEGFYMTTSMSLNERAEQILNTTACEQYMMCDKRQILRASMLVGCPRFALRNKEKNPLQLCEKHLELPNDAVENGILFERYDDTIGDECNNKRNELNDHAERGASYGTLVSFHNMYDNACSIQLYMQSRYDSD